MIIVNTATKPCFIIGYLQNALPLQARIIATKLPQLRTKEDLQCLYRVMNSMKSFKEKLNLEMKKNVCKMSGFLRLELIFRVPYTASVFSTIGV